MACTVGLLERCGGVFFFVFIGLFGNGSSLLGMASHMCYNTVINKTIVNRVYIKL